MNEQDKTLNPVGWGYVEDALGDSERQQVAALASGWLGGGRLQLQAAPDAAAVRIPVSRITSVPDALADCVDRGHHARLLHARGRSFRDLAELRSGELASAPDAVASPGDSEALDRVLAWADTQRYAVIPYGGGSSVVGGVNPENLGDDWRGVVTLSLRRMNHVLDVDLRSATVHAQAGILGPDLDAALKPHGLAVRHYPQSYFHSTLGGWVATRGAGHFSTGLAKIEDRVQALGVTLPDGRRVQTRRLPASSIGIDPNRLWCGSEGILGVITDVHLRCVRQPSERAGCSIRFATFEQALEASRTMLQSGLQPTQLRVLDPAEHLLSRAMAGRAAKGALTVLAFESAGAPVNPLMDAAQRIARDHGGEVEQDDGGGAVGDWKNTFFRQPYLRDAMLDLGVIADTFETAVPWSAVPDFYHAVREATLKAVQDVGGAGVVTCRSTHAYSDGLCLYFGFFAAGRRDALVPQWWQLREAAAQAVLAGGGTLSHHHAMGRDHARWAAAELPSAFRAAITAAKRELDPQGMLNPGLWPHA